MEPLSISDVVKKHKYHIGVQPEFWLKNHDMIQKIIDEYKLKAVSAEMRSHMPASMRAAKIESELTAIRPQPIWGGIKIPHLHFNGDIFLLDEKQWKDFSSKIMKEFQGKLSRANAVSFEQLMKVSDAVDTLA